MADRLVDTTARSDAELITAVRVGDTRAYEELYRRHVDAAMSVGRHLTGSRADAEDVVSEAFARVLSALQRGAGPEMAFRPYLLTSVRNAFYDRTRKDKRLDVTDEVPEDLGRVLAAAAASEDDVERQLAVTAYASLPERWQLVLWHTEVEGRSPAEVGPLLGLAPNAVAALAYRAREGLRQAYLNAHIQARPPAACAETVPKLGAYVRDDLSNRDRLKVEEHLKDCERCQAIVVELREAGSRLRVALIPLIAGIPVAAYLSGIGAGGVGVLAVWGSRVSTRFKELGPGGQVVATLGAVAAAGVLVVGGLAVAQAVTGGGQDQTVAAPGGGDGSGSGSGGGGSGGGGGGGSGSGSGLTSPDAPTPTDAPPTATPSAPGDTSPVGPGPAPAVAPVIPTSATVPRPRPSTTVPGSTPATGPTTAPTTAPPTAPTTAPAASFSVSLGSAGPAYAGLGVTIPVAVGNGAAAAVALGPGRSAAPTLGGLLPRQAGPAGQPTVTVALPTGVSFAGVDNASWTCTVGAGSVQCVLPALAPGATSSGLIQLQLAPNAPATITLQATVADGTNPPVSGPPLVITVQPAPAGVTDLFVDHADLALLGNAVLTCDPAATKTCVTARDNPSAASSQVDKSGQQMIWIDVDADPTTFTSSSAILDLPPGAQVLAAQLVWGGNVQPGAGGVAAPNPSATGSVLLSSPGASAGTPVTADSVSIDPTSATRYLATADVTALVAAAGAGTYTAANVQVATGPGAFGGWALQVVYRDPAAPLRMVALSSQVTTINRGGKASVVLSGLTASSAARTGTVSYAALEGDFGIVPEQVAVNGATLANLGNAPDNPMNGSVTTPGVRAPAFVNNFGFDADQFPVLVAPGQTEVRLDITSSQDRFRVAALGLSVAL